MTMIDTGTIVTRRRKRKVLSPEETLATFRTDGASAAEVREAAQNHVVALAADIKDEAGRNFIAWLTEKALAREVKDPKPATDRAASEALKQTVTETMRQKFEAKVEAEAIRLLEHVTPNGTKLGDCTGAQCRKLGGWYLEIAKRLNPSDHVRNHLDDTELLAIAARYRVI
jgi:hypothetical protein